MLYKDYLTHRRAYQEAGVQLLLERKHACLFYRPGKGKSFPCVEAMLEVYKSNPNAKIIILSTADAIKNMWEAELVPQGIIPSTATLLSFNSAIQDSRIDKIKSTKWDIVIIDECHKVKGISTKTSRLIYRITKNAEYAWGLSGTPRGNSDVDIFCEFHNLNVGEFGTVSYTTFVDKCCDTQDRFFNGHTVRIPLGITERFLPTWEKAIATYTQRVEYNEEDEMPDITANLIEIPFEPTELYKNAVKGILLVKDYETTMAKLQAITKLHELANGYLYFENQNTGEKSIIVEKQNTDKLDKMVSLVKEAKNCTVVYRFQKDYSDICKRLKEENITYTEDVGAFKRGDARVLVLQCSRCESFNLQMCNRIVFYTLDYSYIKYNQMLHRVWRMGQEKDVDIYILIMKGSIEKSIWNTVKNKEQLADLFMRAKRGDLDV